MASPGKGEAMPASGSEPKVQSDTDQRDTGDVTTSARLMLPARSLPSIATGYMKMKPASGDETPFEARHHKE